MVHLHATVPTTYQLLLGMPSRTSHSAALQAGASICPLPPLASTKSRLIFLSPTNCSRRFNRTLIGSWKTTMKPSWGNLFRTPSKSPFLTPLTAYSRSASSLNPTFMLPLQFLLYIESKIQMVLPCRSSLRAMQPGGFAPTKQHFSSSLRPYPNTLRFLKHVATIDSFMQHWIGVRDVYRELF